MKNLNNELVLSLFPGIDLLGKGFENNGFCVVRGPDIITGGNILDFVPAAGKFSGVIGGPPCQDFSKLNRRPGEYGFAMLDEFCRVIAQSECDWFLFENVVTAPDFTVLGYEQQRFALDLAWFSDFSRRRDFVFGSRDGRLLNPMLKTRGEIAGTCVTGADERSFAACCEIQGLPPDFDVPFFTLSGKKQAVANAVPMALSRYVAGLVVRDYYNQGGFVWSKPNPEIRRCACGCGRLVYGRAKYAGATCRKRTERARRKARRV
jgi:DNA (cytosine-5)-methyltransferase 1